ncbi:MAG: hypothetical protein GY711_33275 [bacterium]|nr:hypothetical protein [bacterium]
MMRLRTTACTATLVIGLAAFLQAALPGTAQDPESAPPAVDEAHDDETPLAVQMEIIEESMSKLRRTVRKPEQDAQSLELLSKIQTAVIASKAQPPAMIARVPEGERSAFLAAYRKEMIAFLEQVLAIEKALLEGDHDTARAAHKAASAMEDTGHETFTDDE